MRKIMITAAAAALAFLAASGSANAQGTASIYTSPATVYTPTYYTPSVSYIPSFTYTAPSSYVAAPTISYTYRNYSSANRPLTAPYNPPLNPPVVLTERPTIQTEGLPFGYYTRSDSYPYYNPTLGTYYYAPDFNPGVTNGYYSYRYPSAYAPYRTYWYGTPYYRSPSSPIIR